MLSRAVSVVSDQISVQVLHQDFILLCHHIHHFLWPGLEMALNFMNFINSWMQFTLQCLGSRLKYFILEEIFWNVLLCPCVLAVIYAYLLMLTSATSGKYVHNGACWSILLPNSTPLLTQSRYLLKLSLGPQATLSYMSDILEEYLRHYENCALIPLYLGFCHGLLGGIRVHHKGMMEKHMTAGEVTWSRKEVTWSRNNAQH